MRSSMRERLVTWMLRVEAYSRLHLGQLDLNGSLGRMHGGIGVALEEIGRAHV